jgi:ketosteroid isomerase-like protein
MQVIFPVNQGEGIYEYFRLFVFKICTLIEYLARVKFDLKISFFSVIIIFILSCKQKQEKMVVPDKSVLLESDRAFSKFSYEKGMKAAFLEYLDSNGILLRPDHMPIIGADAVDYLIQQDDSQFSLTWQPQGATIAQSGELGFTYGVYALTPSVKDTVIYGTYTTIWKKQSDGKWKCLLDSGNPGIGEKAD